MDSSAIFTISIAIAAFFITEIIKRKLHYMLENRIGHVTYYLSGSLQKTHALEEPFLQIMNCYQAIAGNNL
ncbi:hypothetical protein LSPH24S_07271 [Lysinibacillus sphaericus]